MDLAGNNPRETRIVHFTTHFAVTNNTLIQNEIDLNGFVSGCLLAYPTTIPFNLFQFCPFIPVFDLKS